MGRAKGTLKQTKINFAKTVTGNKEQTSTVLTKKDPVEKLTSVPLKKTDVSADVKTEIIITKKQVKDQDRSFVYVCTKCEGKFDSKKKWNSHECTVVYTIDPNSLQDNAELSLTNNSIEYSIDDNDVEEEMEFQETEVEEVKEKKSSTKKSTAPISCEICGKAFTRKYHLDRHLLHTSCCPETKTKDHLSCEVCGKSFTRVDNLRMHLRAHLGVKSRSRTFECSYCEKTFYGSSLLNIHIRTHTGDKPFKCGWEGCDKAFPSSGAQTKHRRVHTGERPYECDICNNRFSARETLNRHKKTHTGKRDHVCKICGKTFIQNTQLKSHMFHHTGENAFTCDHCGKQFNRKMRLTEHVSYVHQGKQPPTCGMCKKQFIRREDLNRHLEIHTGKRIHLCPYPECGKNFVTKPAVKIHFRTHSKEEPSICSYCNRSFVRMDCLVRHMRTKHRNQLQDIIASAEQQKMIKAQLRMAGATNADVKKEEKVDGDIEIIYYNNDQVECDEYYEIIPIAEEEPEKTKNDPKEVIKTVHIISQDTTNKRKRVSNTKPEPENETKSKISRKAKTSKVESDEEETGAPIFLNDDELKKRISELLSIVIEESILSELGFGIKSVDEVLCAVIEQCSRQPLTKDSHEDDSTRMRENTKSLFSLVLDEEHIKSLLNNYTVDEVLTIVLKMSK